MTRKPDDVVGTPSGPAAGGGKQTAQQEAITRQSGGGVADDRRNAEWSVAGGAPGRAPVVIGGSSGGHADQKAGDDGEGEKSAAGLTRTEQTSKVDGSEDRHG